MWHTQLGKSHWDQSLLPRVTWPWSPETSQGTTAVTTNTLNILQLSDYWHIKDHTNGETLSCCFFFFNLGLTIGILKKKEQQKKSNQKQTIKHLQYPFITRKNKHSPFLNDSVKSTQWLWTLSIKDNFCYMRVNEDIKTVKSLNCQIWCSSSWSNLTISDVNWKTL